MTPLLVGHAAVTWALVGLVWTIQVVHYPLFRHASPEAFPAFHAEHARRVTALVAVLMPLEALAAGWLAMEAGSVWTWAGLGLVLAIWLVTALVQVPLHERLSRGHDEATIHRLVASNWIRTVAWTVRGAIALRLLL